MADWKFIREKIKERSKEQTELKKSRKKETIPEKRRVLDAKIALYKFDIRLKHMVYLRLRGKDAQKAMPGYRPTAHELRLVDDIIRNHSDPEPVPAKAIMWTKELLEMYLNTGLAEKITFEEVAAYCTIEVRLMFRQKILFRVTKAIKNPNEIKDMLTMIYHEIAVIVFNSAAAKIIETAASISAFAGAKTIPLREVL